MKEKKKIQESYEELKEHYNSLLSLVPCHIYWKNKDGTYLGCNLLHAQNLGFSSPEEIIGKTDFQLPWAEQADTLKAADQQVMNTKKNYTCEEEVLLANGVKACFLSKKAALLGANGEVKGVIGISFDISDQKQLESQLKEAKNKAESSSQAKTEFLENMRHDIRTPLSGIVGFSELLKSESNEPRIKEYADNLIASSHALLDLMDEVLEAVRVGSGEIPMLKRKFSLMQTFEQIIALNQARAHEKKLDLSLTGDSNLPCFVIGDKIRIHRIALELIGNALNFTDMGQVSVNVTLAKKEARQLVIKLTVTDSGMGIPKDKQQDIYLQFKRLTPSYQGIYKGAGLGLYVVKQFMDELGGEIYVTSEAQKGTCFTCLIPLQEPLLDDDSGLDEHEDLKVAAYMAPAKHQQSKASPIPAQQDKACACVLVIEDNYIAQTVARALLTPLACAVDVASNGVEALVLCTKNHYDLIFMDIGLGDGMDGYEVTHHIRNGSTEIKNTPIIALTAHGGDESRQRCIEAGMDGVLTKPLTQAHAVDILKSFIPRLHETPAIDLSKSRKDLPDSDEELFQLNQLPILNSDDALKNCATHEMLKELLTLLIKELPTDLECMKKAFKAHDYPLVEKTAHKIKGGAVYVGTIRMKYACQYVERYWKTGQRELFDALTHQAMSTIEETITYIEGWLQRNKPS